MQLRSIAVAAALSLAASGMAFAAPKDAPMPLPPRPAAPTLPQPTIPEAALMGALNAAIGAARVGQAEIDHLRTEVSDLQAKLKAKDVAPSPPKDDHHK